MRNLAVAGMAASFLLTGCALPADAICASEEYPAQQVSDGDGKGTGRICVPKGQNPPKGYVRYPVDKEPKHVDDTWDKYWRYRGIDENGNPVK